MRVALDTNILVYAHGIGDDIRISAAVSLLPKFAYHLVVPTQVLAELFNVLSRIGRFGKDILIRSFSELEAASAITGVGRDTMARAMHLSLDHAFQIWDALIVETAVEAGCKILLSEDMQHGFYWNGLTIINPFTYPVHPLLASAFELVSGSPR